MVTYIYIYILPENIFIFLAEKKKHKLWLYLINYEESALLDYEINTEEMLNGYL